MLYQIIKSMRPRQWTKNVFLLAALVFDQQLTNWSSLKISLLGFFIFCLVSGSVYLLNDIIDIDADRQHPLKKLRPIAAGKLSIHAAGISAGIILSLSFTLAYLLSLNFFIVAAIYLLTNILYSRWLKHIPILDVLIIALGFVLRVAAGVSLIEVERFSPWLYVVMTLGALYLGFGKRRAELACLAEKAENHRKVLNGYSLKFLDQLITIVSSTTIVAYSLYTFSAPNLPSNHSMMLTIPFVLYGIFRYLYLIEMKGAGGEPEELLLTDKPLQVCILLFGLSIILIFYVGL